MTIDEEMLNIFPLPRYSWLCGVIVPHGVNPTPLLDAKEAVIGDAQFGGLHGGRWMTWVEDRGHSETIPDARARILNELRKIPNADTYGRKM